MEENSTGLHPSVAAFMKDPISILCGQDHEELVDMSSNEESSLIREVQYLRSLVNTTEEEVNILRKTITELEAKEFQENRKFLLQLYADLSTPPPPPLLSSLVTNDGIGTEAEVRQLLTCVKEELLRNVQELEEQTTMCRFENNEKEKALRSLHVGILALEKRKQEHMLETQAGESICNALRLKLQEAQRRVWDYRQRETFVCAAEKKYLEQMDEIQRMREEIRTCGLRLPVLEPGGGEGAVIPTCNRFRWERHCARRVKALRGGPLLQEKMSIYSEDNNDLNYEDDTNDPESIIVRVLFFSPGVLQSLQNITLGNIADSAQNNNNDGYRYKNVDGKVYTDYERRDKSSGLRRHAQSLGISLEYQQHMEVNPFLSRSFSEETGKEENKETITGGRGGVKVIVRGKRRLVDQFQHDVKMALKLLTSVDNDVKSSFCDLTPTHEIKTVFATNDRNDNKISQNPHQQISPPPPLLPSLPPWRAAAEVARAYAMSPLAQ